MTTSTLLVGEGEGIAGALPCSEESKEERKLEAKEEEIDEKWLKLSQEEKEEVKKWIIPGSTSWRNRLRSDPGLGPLFKYLTRDASLDPKADRGELEKQATQIAIEDGLMVRKAEKKGVEATLELVVPNLNRLDLLREAHDRTHRSIDHTSSTLREAGYWWPNMRGDVKEYCD